MAISNSNVSNQTETVIYNILSGDSTLLALTKNIYDGNPMKVAREHGFPLVIIDSPTYDTRKLTMSKWQNVIIVGLEVHSKQESNVRKVFDAMVNAIKSGNNTLSSGGLYCPSFRGNSLSKLDQVDNSTLYIMSTNLELYDVSQ